MRGLVKEAWESFKTWVAVVVILAFCWAVLVFVFSFVRSAWAAAGG